VSLTIDRVSVGTAELITSRDRLEGNGSRVVGRLSGTPAVSVGWIWVLFSAPGVAIIVSEALLVFHFPVSEEDQGIPLPLPLIFVELFVPPVPFEHQIGTVPFGVGFMISVTTEPRDAMSTPAKHIRSRPQGSWTSVEAILVSRIPLVQLPW
jgi:hypothetical protein